MYLFSFFKSLFKPKNVLSTLYFLANSAIVFFIFYILPFRVCDDPTMNKVYLGLIGLGINLFFIIISLTPAGEAMWRLRNGIKKQPPASLNSAWLAANAVFEEVRERAKSVTRNVSDKVTLYYSPTKDINAYALGHRTVIVTAGILRVPSEYLKGVLAHELGHIAHGDSDLNLGINVSNGILTVFMTFTSVFAYLIVGLIIDSKNGLAQIVALFLRVLFNVIIIGLFRLWTLLGVLCINSSSRKAEYLADGFAKELGYGEQLARFLDVLDRSKVKSSKLSLMFQTHPDTVDRLHALGYAA